MRKLAVGLGLAAGFGASILPMATYADDVVSDTDTLDVQVRVATIISMQLESHSTLGTRTTDCDSRDIVVDETTGDITDDGCTNVSDLDNQVKTTLLPSSADTSSMYTDIYVTTNSGRGYVLTLADADTNASLRLPNDTDTIAPISSLPVGGTNPGWAIHIAGDQSGDVDVWRAMPISTGTPITVKSYSATRETVTRDKSTVTYGVATSSSQGSGLYTDTVTYTATAN
ncbi:hypothetical protein IKW75_00320 [Candidatus Saccharibacteria bacterium]|nr:hypothetical protein [Candidatus Saccharibacteria bacterium]